MDNQTYQQIIGEIGTLISIFAPLLTAYKLAVKLGFNKYIESKIGLIKDENLRTVAENIKTRVESLAENTITMLEVVEKPQIISAIESGTMTKDDLKSLKTKAIETVKDQLTTQGQSDLQNSIGDVNLYLNTLIEAKLAQLKVDPTSPVSKTEIQMPTQEDLDKASLQTQLNQIQIDKNMLVQQISQLQNDKANVEQSNSQLTQQVADLTNKINAITSTVNQVSQPSSNVNTITSITDNAQTDTNGITTNIVQATI